MKNKTGKMIWSILLILGAARANGGQNVGNGGDLLCEAKQETRTAIRCHLLDFIEWGTEENLFVEFKRGKVTKKSFRSEDGAKEIYLFLSRKNFESDGYLSGYSVNYFNSRETYEKWTTDEQNRRFVSDSLRIPADSDEFYRALENKSPLFRCADGKLGCATTAIIINRLDEISKIAPVMAAALRERFLGLEWIPVNARLKDIQDESTFIQTISQENEISDQWGLVNVAMQGAVRDGLVVRIDRVPYEKLFYPERAGLIFHEVVYKITSEQGDKDSARARRVVSLLFDGRGKREELIRQASALLKL